MGGTRSSGGNIYHFRPFPVDSRVEITQILTKEYDSYARREKFILTEGEIVSIRRIISECNDDEIIVL